MCRPWCKPAVCGLAVRLAAEFGQYGPWMPSPMLAKCCFLVQPPPQLHARSSSGGTGAYPCAQVASALRLSFRRPLHSIGGISDAFIPCRPPCMLVVLTRSAVAVSFRVSLHVRCLFMARLNLPRAPVWSFKSSIDGSGIRRPKSFRFPIVVPAGNADASILARDDVLVL